MLFLEYFFREAQIGGHNIYKIEDTKLIPIANELVRQKFQHPDETKLVAISNALLSSNDSILNFTTDYI